MIVTKLIGGHSNQLFQYAIGRSLALRHNTDLKLDISWFEEIKGKPMELREYELGCYPLAAEIAEKSDLQSIVEYKKQGKLKSIINFRRKLQYIEEKGLGFNKDFTNFPNNVYLSGYWQCEKYFADIRSILLKEFEPKTKISETNQKIINKMKSVESVWIHVRRGDYVKDSTINSFHGTKDLDYYHNSLRFVVGKIPPSKRSKLEVFICSNDIEWCMSNFKLGYPISFVQNKLGSDDMRVVKHCKHDILANSSFSWWGAWLNDNPDKIVVAPRQWFLDKKANAEIDIIPSEWHKL